MNPFRLSPRLRKGSGVLLFLLSALAGPYGMFAEDALLPDSSGDPPPDLWFPVGEEVVYRVYWGKIRVGTSRATTAWVEEDGRRLLRIRYRTRSNWYLRWIYPVDSVIESYIEPATFRPVRFVNRMSEGRRHHNEETVFDWDRGVARWVSHRKNESHEFPIDPDTRCIPSLMYFLRRKAFEPETEYDFRVMADEKLYDVTLYTEDYEAVSLARYGRVRSLRMEPKATFNGVFIRSGRVWLWISDDERRLATKISAEVPLAQVHLTIDRVLGPGDDRWSLGEDGKPVTTGDVGNEED